MTNAEIIKKLRLAAHGLEIGCLTMFDHSDPFPEIIDLLDQAADALKIAWVEHQTMAALRQLLLTEPTEEQKKQMLRSFDHEAKIS